MELGVYAAWRLFTTIWTKYPNKPEFKKTLLLRVPVGAEMRVTLWVVLKDLEVWNSAWLGVEKSLDRMNTNVYGHGLRE